MNLDLVTFNYVNHRGEKSQRRVRPIRLWHGSTAWHSQPQWLLEAFDLDKMETRDFAMEFVVGWRVLTPEGKPNGS